MDELFFGPNKIILKESSASLADELDNLILNGGNSERLRNLIIETSKISSMSAINTNLKPQRI